MKTLTGKFNQVIPISSISFVELVNKAILIELNTGSSTTFGEYDTSKEAHDMLKTITEFINDTDGNFGGKNLFWK